MSAALVLAAGVLLCVLFVPRENALDHIEEWEQQEKKAQEIAQRKTLELKETVSRDPGQFGGSFALAGDGVLYGADLCGL